MPFPAEYQNLNLLVPEEIRQIVRNKKCKLQILLLSQVDFKELNLITSEKSSMKASERLMSALSIKPINFPKVSANAGYGILIKDREDKLLGYGLYLFDKEKKEVDLFTLNVSLEVQRSGFGKIIMACGVYLARFLDVASIKGTAASEKAAEYYKHLKITKSPTIISNLKESSSAKKK